VGVAYCGVTGQALQRDCVQALSRVDCYTLENILTACGPCNTSKCNGEVTGWLRRKWLNEAGLLLRDSQIKSALAVQFSPIIPGATDEFGLDARSKL
jgi:hypothetical protein